MSDDNEIVCGLHAARIALASAPEQVLEIWVLDSKRETRSIRELLRDKLAEVQWVTRPVLDKLSGYQRHQGIVLRRRRSSLTSTDIESLLSFSNAESPLFLVLDGVQDPHNLGACLRTADAAGVRAVILPKDRAVSVNATVSKVAAGAAESVPVIEVINLSRVLDQMRDAGIWIIGTTDSASESLYSVDLCRPLALVMGAEGKGLRENTAKHCDLLVNLPMTGVVESLNVSVATGICLYEALRQQQAGH